MAATAIAGMASSSCTTRMQEAFSQEGEEMMQYEVEFICDIRQTDRFRISSDDIIDDSCLTVFVVFETNVNAQNVNIC